jgi:hypothetical protein
MIQASVFPAILKAPQSADLVPAERRALSEIEGKRSARALSVDRLSQQNVVFTFLNGEELDTWLHWGRVELIDWSCWFVANWSQPQGGSAVRRFVGAPSYPKYFANVGWMVNAIVQIRGRGEFPNVEITAPAPPPPETTPLFTDLFPGSAGSVAGHVPALPTDSSWLAYGDDSLTGDGFLIVSYDGSDIFLTTPATYPANSRIDINVKFKNNDVGILVPFFQFYFGGTSVFLQIESGDGLTLTISSSTPSWISATVDITGLSELDLLINLSASSYKVTANGSVVIDGASYVSTPPNVAPLALHEVYLSSDSTPTPDLRVDLVTISYG